LKKRTKKLLFLGASLLAAGFVVRAFPQTGHWARNEGAWRFLLLATATCAVGMPRQAIAFAAGYADGVIFGSLLALVCETAACLLDVVWARSLARDWVRARLPNSVLARVDAALAGQPFIATLSLRLLPVGNNLLLNLAAGVSQVRLAPFLLASALGFIPQTVIFALLGGGIGVDRSVQLAVGVALFALSTGLGAFVFRRQRAASMHA